MRVRDRLAPSIRLFLRSQPRLFLFTDIFQNARLLPVRGHRDRNVGRVQNLLRSHRRDGPRFRFSSPRPSTLFLAYPISTLRFLGLKLEQKLGNFLKDRPCAISPVARYLLCRRRSCRREISMFPRRSKLHIKRCVATESKKFNFIFERSGVTRSMRYPLYPHRQPVYFPTETSPFSHPPSIRFPTDKQRDQFAPRGANVFSRFVYYSNFSVRSLDCILRPRWPFVRGRGQRRKRSDTDSYSRLRVFAFATGERSVVKRDAARC